MQLEENAKNVLMQTGKDTVSEPVGSDELVGDIEQQNKEIHEQELSKKEKNEDVEDKFSNSEEDGLNLFGNQTDHVLIEGLTESLNTCIDNQKSLEMKVVQTLKENANFQIQVRQNMQKELEEAKKKLSGDIFIPLLKEIAELYSEWCDVIGELDDGVQKRKVSGVFEVLEEMLEEYGCELIVSEKDSKRRPKYSKLKNKVPTAIKEQHETIAKSYNACIVKEPFVLYPEYVDVYVYDSSLEEKTIIENDITQKEE